MFDIIASYVNRPNDEEKERSSLMALNEMFPQVVKDTVAVVYEHQTWIIPAQRWGVDSSYEGAAGGRVVVPRWLDEEGPLPDCDDGCDTPYVELPVGFRWEGQWVCGGWEYAERCNEVGHSKTGWTTELDVRKHLVRRCAWKRVLHSVEGQPYVSREYQQLLAHTTSCYQLPLASYPHSQVAMEECIEAAVQMGYARDLATTVAMTMPHEFLLPELLIARLQRPSQTAIIRRDLWEERQRKKAAEAERERNGFWPSIEQKWAEEEACNNRVALNYKAAAQREREQRDAEFESILQRANDTAYVARQEREVSSMLLEKEQQNMYRNQFTASVGMPLPIGY